MKKGIRTDENGESLYMRAVVFVTEDTTKSTARSAQEYQEPLLVLTGEEYANITFEHLYTKICQALRGDKPRVVAQYLRLQGHRWILFDNGTFKESE